MPVLKLTFANGSQQEFPFALDSTVAVESTVWVDGSSRVKRAVWAEIAALEVVPDPAEVEPAAETSVVASAPLTFADIEVAKPAEEAVPEPAPVVEEPVPQQFFGRSDR